MLPWCAIAPPPPAPPPLVWYREFWTVCLRLQSDTAMIIRIITCIRSEALTGCNNDWHHNLGEFRCLNPSSYSLENLVQVLVWFQPYPDSFFVCKKGNWIFLLIHTILGGYMVKIWAPGQMPTFCPIIYNSPLDAREFCY